MPVWLARVLAQDERTMIGAFAERRQLRPAAEHGKPFRTDITQLGGVAGPHGGLAAQHAAALSRQRVALEGIRAFVDDGARDANAAWPLTDSDREYTLNSPTSCLKRSDHLTQVRSDLARTRMKQVRCATHSVGVIDAMATNVLDGLPRGLTSRSDVSAKAFSRRYS